MVFTEHRLVGGERQVSSPAKVVRGYFCQEDLPNIPQVEHISLNRANDDEMVGQGTKMPSEAESIGTVIVHGLGIWEWGGFWQKSGLPRECDIHCLHNQLFSFSLVTHTTICLCAWLHRPVLLFVFADASVRE